MGRFRADEADHYGGNGGSSFFSLKNDKDVARVRFMYNSIEDVEGYAVHEVMIDGKKKYINCLRDYNDPIDKCPFCRAKMFQNAKLFIPLYNVDEEKTQLWERGKKFFSKISSLCARYGNDRDIVSQVFEIERNGRKGETTTTYEIYPVGQADNTTLDDLPDIPSPMGNAVLDKSVDDMEFFIENEYFPPEDDDDVPVRRRANHENRDNVDEEELPFNRGEDRRSSRRTPVSSRERF